MRIGVLFVLVLLLSPSVLAFSQADKDFIESTSRHFNDDCKRYIDGKSEQTNKYMVEELDKRYEQFTMDYRRLETSMRYLGIKAVVAMLGVFLLANQLVSFLDLLRERKKSQLRKALGVEEEPKKKQGRPKKEEPKKEPDVIIEPKKGGFWKKFFKWLGTLVLLLVFAVVIIVATMFFTGGLNV